MKREIHEFLSAKSNGSYTVPDFALFEEFLEYVRKEENTTFPKKRVALLFICINEPYWQYIKDAIDGAKKFFLPWHNVDIFLWSDVPAEKRDEVGIPSDVTIFPVDPIEWPYPTLFRYNMFLQQNEQLSKYDFLFYSDIDMRFVNYIGDEILPKEGFVAAQHPMYAFKRPLWIPFEPNPDSAAHIKIPGKFVNEGGKLLFKPFYYAGGFQGGTTKAFFEASEAIAKTIDKDLGINYIARWNDESHLNRYLADHEPEIVLSPSFVYPDSLIEEYYKPIWGCDYPPKIVTITKKFSLKKLSEEEQKELQGMKQVGKV